MELKPWNLFLIPQKKNKMLKKFLSSSNWENSYFGGFDRVLYDHPEITVPFQLDTEPPVDEAPHLSYYLRNKLPDLFLLKVIPLQKMMF